MTGASGGRARTEGGFTRIELLLALLLIVILTAMALPIFVNQREKAYQSRIQSALKDAATAVESWAVGDGANSFEDLDEQDGAFLAAEGFKVPEWTQAPGNLSIEATRTTYCIQARYNELSPDNQWREATYESDVGQPQISPNVCPELTP